MFQKTFIYENRQRAGWPTWLTLAIKNILMLRMEIQIENVDNGIVLMLIFLSVISILWFCRKTSLFLRYMLKYLE